MFRLILGSINLLVKMLETLSNAKFSEAQKLNDASAKLAFKSSEVAAEATKAANLGNNIKGLLN